MPIHMVTATVTAMAKARAMSIMAGRRTSAPNGPTKQIFTPHLTISHHFNTDTRRH